MSCHVLSSLGDKDLGKEKLLTEKKRIVIDAITLAPRSSLIVPSFAFVRIRMRIVAQCP